MSDCICPKIGVKLLMAFGASAMLAGCASTVRLDDSSRAVSVSSELPAPDVTVNRLDFSNYRIGPNDVLLIEVLQAPELRREGVVDAGGNFSLPVVGDVFVGGKTPGEVSELIENELRGSYILDPQVSVNIAEARSQLVTIDGAVRHPGMYPVIGRMTLQQAIASARGADMVADLDSVVVFRDIENERMAALFSLNEIRSGRVPDPQVYGNDIIVVGENAARRFFRDLNFFPRPGSFIPVM